MGQIEPLNVSNSILYMCDTFAPEELCNVILQTCKVFGGGPGGGSILFRTQVWIVAPQLVRDLAPELYNVAQP